MAEKIQFAVYQVLPSTVVKRRRRHVSEAIDIAWITNKMQASNYRPQQLATDSIEGFDLTLFYRKSRSQIRWKEFIRTIAKEGEKIIKKLSGPNESFVLFLKKTEGSAIYAVTGGFGHTAIQEIVNPDFGLELFSRLLKSDDKVLHSAKERTVTGGVMASAKYFRKEYNLIENENFGSIYNELQAKLSRRLLVETFGFQDSEIRGAGQCIAKKSFTIRKSLNISELANLISKCEDLLSRAPLVELNSLKKLGKSDKLLIEGLNTSLHELVWNIYNHPDRGEEIEICHDDFDKYLGASEYKLVPSGAGIRNDLILQDRVFQIGQCMEYLADGLSNPDKDKLNRRLQSTVLESYDNDGVLLTQDKLALHFFTEIRKEGFSYFHISGAWYQIMSSFVTKLDTSCNSFYQGSQYSGTLEKWPDGTREDEFNNSHIGKTNTLVFDKVTPENIEACDILQWDDNNLYFIHVKKGVNNTTRDLTNQVFVAANRLLEDKISGGGTYFKSLRSTILDSGSYGSLKGQLGSWDEVSFGQLLSGRRLVFVLAILDDSVAGKSGARSLEEFSDYESNIAKFSIHELTKNMRGIGVELQIHKIQHS